MLSIASFPRRRLARALRRPWLGWALCLACAPLWARDDAALAHQTLGEVDIRTLIEAVAKTSGKTFLIDPRVNAKVTLIAAEALPEESLYDVFLSVLDVHGYAAVPSGEVIKIVPDSNAKQLAVPTEGGRTQAADQVVTQVVVVEHIPAAQLVPILRPLVPQQGHLAAYPASNVLVISDRAANVRRIADIVRRIDRADSGSIEVMRLEHASAAEVVRIIDKLQQGASKYQPETQQAQVLADERTNSVLIAGERSERIKLRGLIAHLDIPLEGGGNTQVIFLKYADATQLVDILRGTLKAAPEDPKTPKETQDIDIQADAVNNALVITAEPDEIRRLQQVVQQLDIRRVQVLVEAVIAEVSTDLSKEIGVQYFVNGGEGGANTAPVLLQNLPLSSGSLSSLAANPESIGSGFFFGLGDLNAGNTNWGVLLSALQGDAATNILSTPTLVTMDNEEATIVVGQNVPFITGQYTGTGSGSDTPSNPFQTIQREDVGITLKVKPQVNEGDSVQLSISQEVSSIASSSIAASDLITNKRSIDTRVIVEDGQILVLGGLIEDTFNDTQQKVPLLGDAPGVGNLFRYTKTSKQKKNLMVFLRPVILRDPEGAERYSHGKYTLLRARQAAAGLGQRGLIPGAVSPLPDSLDGLAPAPEQAAALAPAPPPRDQAPEANHGLTWQQILDH